MDARYGTRDAEADIKLVRFCNAFSGIARRSCD
jgi:hypothetical protein